MTQDRQAGVGGVLGARRSDDLNRTVTRGIMSAACLHGLGLLLQLAFVAILARLLTPYDYGLVAAAMIFIQAARLVSESGVATTLVQLAGLDARLLRVAFTIVQAISLCLFGLAQLTAPWAAAFFEMPNLEPVLRVLSLLFLVQGFGIVAESLLVRQLRVWQSMAVGLVGQAIGTGLVGIALAMAGWGFWALVVATLVQAGIKSVVLVLLVRHPMMPLLDRKATAILLSTGTGFTLSRVLNFVALQADGIIVGRSLGAELLGIYDRAYRLMSLPAGMYTMVADKVAFPAMATVQTEPARLRTAYLRGLALTATVGLPLTVVLVQLAPEIIAVLLGDHWVSVVTPFGLLSMAMYFRLGYKVNDSLLRAVGASYSLVCLQGLYAAMMVGGCLFAYPWGLPAVALAVSAAIGANYCVSSIVAGRAAGASLRDFLEAHLPGAAMSLAVAPAIGGVAYIARHQAQSAPTVIGLALAAALACASAGVWLRPKVLLGSDACMLLKEVRRTVTLGWVASGRRTRADRRSAAAG